MAFYSQPSVLGKLNKFKQVHLEFCTMILIAIIKLHDVHDGSKTS